LIYTFERERKRERKRDREREREKKRERERRIGSNQIEITFGREMLDLLLDLILDRAWTQ
jgi:hypothetical protein